MLSDIGLKNARLNAPQWDIYGLMRTYNQDVRSGKREYPINPDKHFSGFCYKYTKGKPPA